jgi:arylsulfatase A
MPASFEMLKCNFIRCGVLASLALFTGPLMAAGETQGMNVLLVLIDDLGETDLGCYGSKFYETPHLDRLAKESVRFTQAYSACTVCSPTRASLLTGKYPARLHLTDWIPGHGKPKAKLLPPEKWAQELPLAEVTLAEKFKSSGYATASIGKWHLGHPDFYPEKQGFDLNLAGTHAGQPPSYFSPYNIATLPDGPKGEFLTDREAVEAGKFMEANKAGKFFIYLPLHAVHTPLMGKPEVVAKYKNKSGEHQGKPAFAALVESVDDAMGMLRKKLEDLGLWDRTIVIFTSDNGGLALGQTTTNLGMRAGKGSAYEGGVRVPLLVRVPGVTKAGTTCAVPVITPDIFATLSGLALPSGTHAVDGRDLTPLLKGESKLGAAEDAIFWHYPHYHPGGATPYSAVRLGDWKLLRFYEGNRDELYNLKNDPKESTDVAATQADRAKGLRAKLDGWLKATDAQLPRENPTAE